MTKTIAVLKIAGFIIAELIIGFFGLDLIFSDFGPGETALSRMIIIAVFYVLFGLAAGFIVPRRWYLAGIMAWGGILVAVFAFVGNVGAGLRPMFLSLVPLLTLAITLCAGWIGMRLRSFLRWG